jgi:hypothetical protein
VYNCLNTGDGVVVYGAGQAYG